MMSLKSELFNFLLGIPNIQTVKERQALLTAVGFDWLNPRIDWEGSTRVFLNRLLELLCSEGQKELVKFLRNLAIPNLHLVGLENRDKLNRFADEINSLTSEEWDRKFPKTEEQVKPNPPNNILYHGSKNFVGREEELAQIDQNLKKSGIVAISGMGGVGKTELVTQYARRNESDFPGGICWLRARESVLAEEIILFAQNEMQLQVPQQNFQGKTLSLVEQVDWCWKNWRPLEGLVLVILDDVTDFGNCLEFLPKNNRFCLLIATRLRNLDANIEEICLDVLIPEQALELFTAIVGVKRVEKELESAQKLCDELGYLPLGLELLGRYIVKKPPQWTLAKMLERLQRQKIEDEAINPQEEQLIKSLTTAQRGVKAAFELSWRELKPMTQRVGELLSLFAPAIFAWEWVETAAKGLNWNFSDVEAANDELLYGQSLIKYMDEREGFYQIHTLIREFLKVKFARLEDKDSLKREFAGIFVLIAQGIPQSPTQDDIKSVQEAIPHLAEIAENLIDAVSNENLILPFAGLGRYYEGQGLYTFAEPWLKQCVSLLKSCLGEEHPYIATSYNNLAGVYESQGRYEEAESLYLQSLKLSHKLLGEEHPDIAKSYNNLAVVYNSQGRYKEAESLYLQSLELSHKLLGEEHPHVATIYNNLAVVYNSQGRYKEAESLYLQSLELRCNLLGEEHPHVADSYNNIALVYNSQGRYKEAESFSLHSLKLTRKILGEEHPYVATSYNNLASVYESQGRYKEAESFSLHSLKLTRKLLGEEHLYVVTSYNNLALVYKSQGRYEEAESFFLQSLKLTRKLLGEEHLYVVTSYNNLALVYKSQGRYEEAESFFLQSLKLTRKLLGEEHPYVATSYNNLALVYKSQGRYEEAESFFLQSLKLTRKLLGEEHPYVATSYNNLASVYESQGRYKEAESFYLHSLKLRLKLLGEEHPYVATSYNNLASVYESQGRYKEAESFYLHSLEIADRTLGSNHPTTNTIQENLKLLRDKLA